MTTALVRLPDDADAAKDVFTSALELGYTAFLVPEALVDRMEGLARADLVILADDGAIVADGEPVGRHVTVASADDQDAVRDLAGQEGLDLVAVATTDWTVIPLENLIGWFQGTETELLAEVADADGARLALGALERGVDGLVVAARTRSDLAAVRDVLDEAAGAEVGLDRAEVTAVRPLGSGDRVCVDTTAMMEVGEGLLVGSQAGALFLVHSETLETAYVASRPFRVNAGPVHAYVLAPDGATKYLAEVRSGDAVLVVDGKGRTRPAVVGRVKIEQRPLVLVEARVAGEDATIILQNAETVALVTPEGPKSVVDLAPGDEVLVRVGAKGRHFGTAVEERVVER